MAKNIAIWHKGGMRVVRKELSKAGLFYRRREEWIRHVLRLPKAELSHVEKLVAIYVAETANPNAQSWVTSQARIATDLDVGIRIVKSAIAKLKSMGLIHTRRVRLNGNPKLFNAYEIVAVELAERDQGAR